MPEEESDDTGTWKETWAPDDLIPLPEGMRLGRDTAPPPPRHVGPPAPPCPACGSVHGWDITVVTGYEKPIPREVWAFGRAVCNACGLIVTDNIEHRFPEAHRPIWEHFFAAWKAQMEASVPLDDREIL
jgi:hypothetical protein